MQAALVADDGTRRPGRGVSRMRIRRSAPMRCCSRSTTRPAWFAELWRRRERGGAGRRRDRPGCPYRPARRPGRPDGRGGAVRAWRPRRWPPTPRRDAGRDPGVFDGEDLAAVARLWATTNPGRGRPAGRHRAAGGLLRLLARFGLPDRAARGAGRASAGHPPPAGAGRIGRAGRRVHGHLPDRVARRLALVGRTDVTLFDPDRDPPALLTPGHPGAARRTGRAVIEVRQGGPAHHRPGPRPARVRPPGRTPAPVRSTRPALILANRLVGNADGAAGLETTLTGVRPAGRVATAVAVTGAPAQVTVDGRPVAVRRAVRGAGRARWSRSAPPPPVCGPTSPSPAGSRSRPCSAAAPPTPCPGLGPAAAAGRLRAAARPQPGAPPPTRLADRAVHGGRLDGVGAVRLRVRLGRATTGSASTARDALLGGRRTRCR